MRISRTVTALVATGTAAMLIGVSAAPAFADQNRNDEWWLAKDGIDTAWVTTQGAGVTVALLSDGVDASHRDLVGSVTAAPAPAGAPVATGQFAGAQGTPIASLIAGHGHGSRGLAGILGAAPAAKILSIPVTLPPDDPELSDPSVAAAIPNAIAAGIRYAVAHGASVIDLPIDPGQPGMDGTGGASAAAGGSPAEEQAVAYAFDHGVLLVAPAGDDWTSSKAPNYPAAYPDVISVGAFDENFTKAPWSSELSYVTLTGPGVNIDADDNAGRYATISSTAAASAVVAGVAALIRSRYPQLTVTQVTDALTSSTLFHRPKPTAGGSGFGAVDADQALAAAAAMAVPSSEKADAGAQPLMVPPAQTAAGPSQSLGSELLRDALMALGLLVILLLAVGVYALVVRRRTPDDKRPQVTAEWAHRQAQSRYPQASGTDADAMLEYFKTPVAEPPQPGSQAAGAGILAGQDPARTNADSGSFVSQVSLSRAVTRRPPVSGAPPWDPALPPDSEFPWNTSPQPVIAAAASSAGPAGPAGPAALTSPSSAGDPQWPDAARSAPTDLLGDRPAPADLLGGGPGRRALRRLQGLPALPAGSQAWRDDTPSDNGPGNGRSGDDNRRSWRARRPRAPGQLDFGAGRRAEPDPSEPVSQPGIGPGDPSGWRSAPASPAVGSVWGQPASPVAGQRDWSSPVPAASPVGREPGAPAAAPSPSSHAAGTAGPDGQDGQQEQPRTSKAGLPIRTPRHAPSAPLSPSGSLWEPVERKLRSAAAENTAAQNGTSGQNDSRPIYVWRPARTEDDYSAQ